MCPKSWRRVGEAPLVRLSQAQVHPRGGVGAQSALVVAPRGGVSPGEAGAALACWGARAGQWSPGHQRGRWRWGADGARALGRSTPSPADIRERIRACVRHIRGSARPDTSRIRARALCSCTTMSPRRRRRQEARAIAAVAEMRWGRERDARGESQPLSRPGASCATLCMSTNERYLISLADRGRGGAGVRDRRLGWPSGPLLRRPR